ncbi:MAG: type VI secretion system contractile sheath large subunit [Myxococcales bacterium]|nr:type VI secretion system contractile sheath large subunit [Myxococcales bacterium]
MQAATTSAVDQPSLLSTILAETRLVPADGEAYQLVRAGTRTLLDDLLRSHEAAPRVDKDRVQSLIADLDRRLTAQVDAILHHPAVQQLESAWRGLKHLVERVDFRENIRLEFVHATKDDLRADAEDSADTTQSGLYKHLYNSAFGVLGGKPYGVVCATFDVDGGAADLQLLKHCAAVSAMAHVPFLANASPRLLGLRDFTELPKIKDLEAVFEGPQYARWNAFRDHEDSRYVGLCAPRFLLRLPYGKRDSEIAVKAFDFQEDVIDQHERYLWGPAAIALTARIAESFAKYRWCPNIIGPQGGGSVHGLPLHQYEQGGELKTKPPCETAITDRQELQLANLGLCGLVFRQDSDNAAFFSANSTQRPKTFARTVEGAAAQQSAQLGARLPYMFVITRLAHYLKVLQREQIGTWKGRADLERELNRWIRQYVADMPDPSADTRSRKPLRRARIVVEDVEGQVGWYRCSLQIEPFIQFEGVSFTLSLVGKLDKQ